MSLTCEVCKKNKNQAYFSCGYIPKDQRRNKFTVFELYQNPNFGIDICPVWYYRQYTYIYHIYNLIKNGATDLLKLGFHKRFIFNIAKMHNNLVSLDKLKKEKIKNKRG